VRRSLPVTLSLVLVAALGGAPSVAARGGGSGEGTPGPLVFALEAGEVQSRLYTLTDGDTPVLIPGTEGARTAHWSPDGRVLAFGRGWSADDGIFLVNPDGSGLRKLFITTEGEHFGDPLWSPDGAKLIFGVLSPGDGFQHLEIADSLEGTREVIDTELSHASDWLADGRVLGSITRNWQDEETAEFHHTEEIAMVDPDGTVHELTATPDVHEGVAVASPDGTQIAFVESTWNPLGDYSIAVMDIDGGNRRTLLHLGPNLSWPAWSPDGTELLYGRVPRAVRMDGTTRPFASICCRLEGADWAALPGTAEVPAAGGTVSTAVWTGIRALALPDPSTKQLAAMSATSIWPTRDGYRDTVKVRQKMREPARSRIDIYSPFGTLVRRVRFGFTTGVFSYTWNGRRSSGSILPAGRYRVVTTAVDLHGNVLKRTLYVRLYRGSP
jgi:dipeptidyl aminopeptidase/acylaminoacyl peptidase